MILSISCCCGARLKAHEGLVGRSVRCTQCHRPIFIPSRKFLHELDDQPMVRTCCSCGMVVKGPLNWAGTTGACPRCSRPVRLPWPEAKPRELVLVGVDQEAAVASPDDSGVIHCPLDDGADEFCTDSLVEAGPVSQTMVVEDDSNFDLEAPPTELPSLEERRRQSLQEPSWLPTTGKAAPADRASRRRAFDRWAPSLMRHRRLCTAAVLAVATSCLTFLGHQMRVTASTWQGPAPRPQRAFYFDLGTGKLFAASADLTPPIAAPSGVMLPGEVPAGVRAYIFRCGSCEAAGGVAGYLEAFTPDGRQARDLLLKKGPPLDEATAAAARKSAAQGRLIRSIGQSRWVLAESAVGKGTLLDITTQDCPGGGKVHECLP